MASRRGDLLQRYLLVVACLRDPFTSKGDCAVLASITEHADDDGYCWPGVEKMAKKMLISRETVMRAVQRLESHGYLEVERQRGQSNRYRLGLTSAIGATTTSGTGDTGQAREPVASTPPTSAIGAIQPVASTPPDQWHQCHPNSVQELSFKNSVQRTHAKPIDDFEEQERLQEQEQAEEQELKRKQEQRQRESLLTEYRQSLETHPSHALAMTKNWPWLLTAVDTAA